MKAEYEDEIESIPSIGEYTEVVASKRNVDNLRQKIQSRVQRAKKKAEQQQRHGSDSRTRLNFLREKTLPPTRFDEVLEEESRNVDNAVKEILQRRRPQDTLESEQQPLSSYDFFTYEWDTELPTKTLPDSCTEPQLYPSLTTAAEQTTNGFTRRWINNLKTSYLWRRFIGSQPEASAPSSPSPPPPPPPPSQESQIQPGTSKQLGEYVEESEIQQEETPPTEEKKISSHDLIPSLHRWDPCINVPAFMVPPQVRVKWEEQMYYVPSSRPVQPDVECGVILWPCDLEEEGMHVHVNPNLRDRNKNKIENRIRQEKNVHLVSCEIGTQPLRPEYFRCFETANEEWDLKGLTATDRFFISDDKYHFDLNLHLEQIYFTHHHLFNTEQVLASVLKQLCDKMQEYTNRDLLQLIDARMCAVMVGIEGIENEAKLDNEKKKRLETYIQEMKQLRNQKDEEELNERLMLKKILSTWKMIKEVRAKENYTSTNILLQINKIEMDENEDQEKWNSEIQKELEQETVLYKVMQKLKPKRRKKENPSNKFDKNSELKKIKAKAMKNRRRPGEPKLIPVLTYSGVISDSRGCPDAEQKRRSQLEKTKIFIRVLFNSKEACHTRPKFMSSNFVVSFGQKYILRIFQKPENITLEIYEMRNWIKGHTLIGEVYIPLPNNNTNEETAREEEMHFSSICTIEHKNNSGIGCGPNLRINDISNELRLAGSVRYSVWWGTNKDGDILSPDAEIKDEEVKMKNRDNEGAAGIANKTHLRKWIQQSQLDPNHPTNSAYLPMLQETSETTIGPQMKHFRLNHLQEEFDFTTDDDINNNPRFRLLQLRDQKVPEFQGLQFVPINTREIPSDAFDAYIKRQQEEKEVFQSDDIDVQRVRTQKYLGQVYENILKQHKNIAHRLMLENIVAEEQIPDIRTLSLAMLRIAEPRRPLRPIRQEVKKIPSQIVGNTNINIIITVARGFNLPIRRDFERVVNSKRRLPGFSVTRSPKQESNSTLSQPLVCPVIEISFERYQTKTTTAEGANPTWNQSVRVPLQISANELSQERLHHINSTLYLNVFDEVKLDILDDERDREVRVHQRIERHWLGVLKIPFATLYLNSRIEGTFQLETPPAYLGYIWNTQSSTQIAEEAPFNLDASYLSLFITLDPGLPLPETLDLNYDSEDPQLHLYCDKWLPPLVSNPCIRVIKTFIIDYDGKTNFVTKYIQPLNPPQDILDLNLPTFKTMAMLARFVSLIPCHSQKITFPGFCEIWTSCDRMLNMRSGSVEEHANLLCNYFLFLNQNAWLAFGTAVPEGPTAYVLTQEGNNFKLWRSTSGQCFNCSDHFSPLVSLDCLVNQHNIWVNIQHHRKPSQINFNLTKTQLWKPFFNKNFPSPSLKTVQPQQLNYVRTNENYAFELQDRLERYLRDCVMQWRSRHRTPWNRHCNNALRKILPKLEKMRNHLLENSDPIQEELSDILLAYKVNGFPLDMPYSDLDSIREAVYATGVHAFEHPDTEFSLCVYIHPYPNNIFAVWVYVAALLKR